MQTLFDKDFHAKKKKNTTHCKLKNQSRQYKDVDEGLT